MDIKTNFFNILNEAKKIQEDIAHLQKDLDTLHVTGTSGINLVQVEMQGNYFIQNIRLDPSIFKEDKQIIEELIKSATNDAINKIKKQKNDKLAKMKLPLNLKDVF